jgi:hypothetical protein
MKKDYHTANCPETLARDETDWAVAERTLEAINEIEPHDRHGWSSWSLGQC